MVCKTPGLTTWFVKVMLKKHVVHRIDESLTSMPHICNVKDSVPKRYFIEKLMAFVDEPKILNIFIKPKFDYHNT